MGGAVPVLGHFDGDDANVGPKVIRNRYGILLADEVGSTGGLNAGSIAAI
jgi:hypothetical protein